MLNRGLDKVELLRIVEAVANEKSIDKEIVLESMESAIQKAALTKFGTENNIRVIIDRLTGEIKIQKVLDIVEKVEDTSKEIILKDAIKISEKNKEKLVCGCGCELRRDCLTRHHKSKFHQEFIQSLASANVM